MKLTIINSIRTNNFKDDLLMQKITGMWKEASPRLTNHNSTTYGVYHEYESDYKGDYSLSIAIEDNAREPLLVIPDDTKYEIFSVDTSEEQGILNAWKEIWRREDAGTLERAYSYDFEKYYPSGDLEIYIAIR